jgi:hypothetical protein
MRKRKVKIYNGKSFTVPTGVQRIDSDSTHGWQVRYQGTKFFSDGVHGGADKALAEATKELFNRIATMPAPVTLKREPSPIKSSKLPPGISGPIVVAAKSENGARSAILSVILPQYGTEPALRRIYIGTENTYTQRRYREALAEAKALRAEAVAAYEEAATRARRKAANALRATLRA